MGSFKLVYCGKKILNFLNSKKSVALVSDAGMPSICDPGEDLIKSARSIGIKIMPLMEKKNSQMLKIKKVGFLYYKIIHNI